MTSPLEAALVEVEALRARVKELEDNLRGECAKTWALAREAFVEPIDEVAVEAEIQEAYENNPRPAGRGLDDRMCLECQVKSVVTLTQTLEGKDDG